MLEGFGTWLFNHGRLEMSPVLERWIAQFMAAPEEERRAYVAGTIPKDNRPSALEIPPTKDKEIESKLFPAEDTLHERGIGNTSGAERSWVKKLLYILRHGQADTAVAIMTNLNEFVRTTELLTGEAFHGQDFEHASPTSSEKMRAVEELIRQTRALGQVTRDALRSGKGLRKGPQSGAG